MINFLKKFESIISLLHRSKKDHARPYIKRMKNNPGDSYKLLRDYSHEYHKQFYSSIIRNRGLLSDQKINGPDYIPCHLNETEKEILRMFYNS